MYRVKLTSRAKRELKNISKLHLLALSEIFEDLKDSPYLGKPLNRKLDKKFSYRVGVYRIIYQVSKKDGIIYILTAGHRESVYK